ncbi:mechanosensitive ion channel family protein [Leptolyngbya sp. FACHB-711]|uniref:mechanosensitive ion channel family protein n=1 Tax=unclassified Leptolyngbya TaxID=2650499 RepID=UPI0016821A70|nr:mechanosensitive ion channel family protein [Leptolyngbya sp. FACHB-711]MBD1850153.1 mechanosensitive ion channel [Cyanobacteria bacterium FACHB-502]MBD2025546.1 mechanosensitive ion channel [Leptolyngbya sp. FACHB-711]
MNNLHNQPPRERAASRILAGWLRQLHLRKLGYGLIGLATAAIVLTQSGILAVGQASSLPREALPPQLRQFEQSFPQIRPVPSRVGSGIDRGVVRLDGRRLFTIAVPEVEQADKPGENRISSRISLIQKRLQQIIDRQFDPETLQVTARVDPTSRQPIISARYEADSRTYEDELLTVTALDAEVNGSSLEDWADQLTVEIADALVRAQQERQPQSIKGQTLRALITLLAIGISSLSLLRFQRQLQSERRTLSVQSKSNAQQLSDSTQTPVPSTTSELLQRRAANQQQQGVNDIKRRLSQTLQIILWGGGLFFIVGLFPYSRWLQPLLVQWIQIPLRLLAVGIVTYLGVRVSAVLIDRFFLALQDSSSFDPSAPQRLVLRFTTFSRVAKSIAALLCVITGILIAVTWLGLQVNPVLLTLTGVAGVGISLASQNVIKDVINGFLILLEDQYGVGDVVAIGEVTGLVENMNLRITQLRNEEGRLITIPNSAITIVQNLSKEWSRVDINISVAHTTDLNQALIVVEQVAMDMTRDPYWQDLIIDQPALLGVDKLDSTGSTIRLWIKTQPLKQWEVAREYRKRLKLAFDSAGIAIGIPQQAVSLQPLPDEDDRLEELRTHRAAAKDAKRDQHRSSAESR